MQVDAQPVRWGIVSTAGINQRVLPEVRESPQVELLAVASRSQESADRYAAQEGIPRAHGSYEALLADEDVEAVYIPLPNSMHVEWTLKALEAGKHVLCEKPMSRRAAEVERAFDAAARVGRILSEGFMYRHHPQSRQAKELVEAGEIGELRVLRASFGFTLGRAGDVRLSADLDGGSLMDVGCYCVSGTRLFAGEPEIAIGRQVVGPSGVDVRFTGTLVFPGDLLAHFDCGFDVPGNSLLEAVGEAGKPVLLKRGLSNTVEEWLLSAEYVVAHGNPDVVLCERGIRTFETGTRNTLDLSAVPLVKSLSHLPVIVDPSHATGHRHLVPSMALAAVAAGADGLLIEVHPSPDDALSDGPQSLTFEQFGLLMDDVRRLVTALRHQLVGMPSQDPR
jgi:predicted dehydrogenase